MLERAARDYCGKLNMRHPELLLRRGKASSNPPWLEGEDSRDQDEGDASVLTDTKPLLKSAGTFRDDSRQDFLLWPPVRLLTLTPI